MHIEGLSFVDHAAWNVLSDWEARRKKLGGSVVIEWQQLSHRSEGAPPADRTAPALSAKAAG